MLSTFLDIACLPLRSSRRSSCIRVLPKLPVSPLSRHLVQFIADSRRVVIGTADELTGQAVYAFVTLKPCALYQLQIYIVIFIFPLGNSNTTPTTTQLSPKNSFFKSEKSSDLSQLPRKYILLVICPKHVLAR
jgi:hypothetical protein